MLKCCCCGYTEGNKDGSFSDIITMQRLIINKRHVANICLDCTKKYDTKWQEDMCASCGEDMPGNYCSNCGNDTREQGYWYLQNKKDKNDTVQVSIGY